MNKILWIYLFFFILPIFSQEITELWELALPGKVLSSPVERKKGDLILICEDRRLYSININSGTINWKIKPGGKLIEVILSLDGSIIVQDNFNIYSIFSDGSIRWQSNFESGFTSNITTNERGDIFVVSDKSLIKLDRFGLKSVISKGINSNQIGSLNNSLIVYSTFNSLVAVTLSGKNAWSKSISNEPVNIKSYKKSLYLVFKNGIINKYTLEGLLVNSWETSNTNSILANINYDEDFLIIGDLGTSLISDNKILTYDNNNPGLFYSNGILIKSNSNWTINAQLLSSVYEFYPSGKKQVLERTISLSDKEVWNDYRLSDFYRNIILYGNRKSQLDLLENIKTRIQQLDLLDKNPNFYEILLLACSKQNKYEDVRQEAYKIIGLSKDISFLPYLMSDLEDEKSYVVIPYIFYALGQLGIDRTGGVINLINSKIDDYFDETLVINALYALYYINNYTNSEYVDTVFMGIEKILSGGYSRNIENRCYEILKKIK